MTRSDPGLGRIVAIYRAWVDRGRERRPIKKLILDLDSSGTSSLLLADVAYFLIGAPA